MNNRDVWVFAAAVGWLTLYLVSAPVYAAFVLSEAGAGLGIGYFTHVGAVKRADLYASGVRRMKNRPKQKIKREILSYLIKHVNIERIFVSGILSFQDAMYTALLWGALNAVSAVKPLRIQNNAKADFALGYANMEVTGILSVPAGHIMIAAGIHAAIALRERIRLWKNIRSKG